MSLLDKVKDLKKVSFLVKGSVYLDEKSTEDFNELSKIVGIKELLTVALLEPKSLKATLKKNKKYQSTINQKIELSQKDTEALNGLLADGFSMDEILNVAFSKLNIPKSLKEIKTSSDASGDE